MPVYTIQAPDGRSFELEGDSPPTEQELEEVFATLPQAGLKPSTQQLLAEQEAARQSIIQQAQRSGLEKAIGGTLDIGKAIAAPVVSMVKGVGALPELFAAPERIPATAGETARRTGMDVVQLSEMLGEAFRPKSIPEALFGPAGPLAASLVRGIGNLRSFTPTEEQIQQQLQEQQFDPDKQIASAQDVAQERSQVRFEGAEPTVAEGLTQAIQTVVPVGAAAKGLSTILKGTAQTVKNAPRLLRSVIKPSNPKVAQKVETAVENRFGDIYAKNPEAHTTAASPYEGFVASAESTLDDVTKQLNDFRAAAGQTNNSGQVLAQKIRDRAARLKASGGRADDISALEQRAKEIEGINTTDGLQDAVTEAGRKVDWNQPRTRAQEFADEIIHKEGGKELNALFETAKGPEAGAIRKKWGELKLIQEEASKRLNKIINQAPKNVRPALFEALSSTKGLAGTLALLQGYASGALALGVAGAETWLKKVAKDLKDPNTIIYNIYEDARVNPPAIKTAPVRPPPIPDDLNTALKRAMTPEELNLLAD